MDTNLKGLENQQSVIQSTPAVVQFSKNSVTLLSKANSVIQSTCSPALPSIQGAVSANCLYQGAVSVNCLYQGAVSVNCLYQGAVSVNCLYQGAVSVNCLYQGAVSVNCLYRRAVSVNCLYQGAVSVNCLYQGAVSVNCLYQGAVCVQVLDSEPVHAEGEAARRRREILTRRPSYRKILSDLGGAEISEDRGDGDAETLPKSGIVKVIPTTIQLPMADSVQTLHPLAVSVAGAGGGNTVLHYTQADGQFYVPVSLPTVSGGLKLDQTSNMVLTSASPAGSDVIEEVTHKRETRLYKNREAARECRRKKKEYIKCLESRVAVLENQNKALIEELKSLKELYCQN
ncbi:Cyclic AMP-responsive element-binding protein [Amphibalanus amphitrite]|uniref:Cyclic AMP-responsive element-binding protein n=1 Tax=Amphibalanus amphitrite TaxID=1232801 RepID=A0A6A4VAA5_AMPAM|nr:Cyclic AMP-responsive element-binding protein [Amphibalanus amphitrite]